MAIIHTQKNRGFTIVELLIVIVVIAILASITIVSYNGISNRAKEAVRSSELNSWKKLSEVKKIEKNITCPENYSFVYGNAIFGTSDFCVMKYEAKNVGGVPTSQAAGVPWVNISHVDATTAAPATGGHLLTEAEWMTIAADVLSVKYNWSGGQVGSGIIYQGHVGNNPGSAIAASTDDTDTLNGITGNTGTTAGNNSSRVLYLSSGDVIWDFSGNVYELTGPTQVMNQIGVSGDSSFSWRDWSLGTLSTGTLPVTSRPATLNAYTNPISGSSLASLTWDTNSGIGHIYSNYADNTSRAYIRGGSWNNGSHAGVLAVALNYVPTNAGSNVGFRVAR